MNPLVPEIAQYSLTASITGLLFYYLYFFVILSKFSPDYYGLDAGEVEFLIKSLAISK